MKQQVQYKIRTEEEFYATMEAVDQVLRTENVPIRSRQIQGWLKFSERFGLGLSWDDPLSQKVMDWFQERYGELLKTDFAGETAVLIRGDLYSLRIPRMWGTVLIVCDAHLLGIRGSNPIGPEIIPVINVLEFVEGLTKNYATALTTAEKTLLQEKFHFGHQAWRDIDRALQLPVLIENQARGDLTSSLSHLVDPEKPYGLSQWHSLQAVEKFIKAYIVQKHGTLPEVVRIHDFSKVVDYAKLYGLPSLPPQELAHVQCSPSVRYGEKLVAQSEALRAHYSMLTLCAQVSKSLSGQKVGPKCDLFTQENLPASWIRRVAFSDQIFIRR